MADTTYKTDREYLLKRQYTTSVNLDARVALHQRFGTNPYGWHRFVFDQLELPDICAVLECGCGPGHLWRENRDRVPQGWNVILSDFSQGMVSEAEACLAADMPRMRFECFDIAEIPLEDESLDGVIANHMLYHVPDRPKAFSEIRRILKPGGRFFAATNGVRHMYELEETERELGLRSDFGHGSLEFRLENGREQLAPFFAEVDVRCQEGGLIVTEAEPLVDYMLSASTASGDAVSRRDELIGQVAKIIAKNGPIRITKATGLFVAVKV